jgi:murein DD-endopeptidase MepM/ murein hydrolase activator NlpD
MNLNSFAFAAMALLAGVAAAEPISVFVGPRKPLIEQGKAQQLLNIDFLVKNESKDKIELSEIEVSVLGEADRLLAQYRVGGNGGSIQVVPNRVVEAGKSELVFNPLYAFPKELDLSRLRFTFKFDVDNDTKYTVEIPVSPTTYKPKVQLQLPVAGPVLVHDGHDFYGHHRRLSLLDPMPRALRWIRNFMRYSYDFVVTDEQGRMYRGEGLRNEDWYGWGKPVLAPAAGTVVRAVGTIPDNALGRKPPFSKDEFIANPALMWGNYVEIEHGDGEISLLAHMKQDSLKVKLGDTIKAGQPIGEMGFSGDAFLVHLHYDLKNGMGFDAEGLPSPFNNFERLGGKGWLKVRQGQVDSGDVVRPAARK